MHTKRNSEISEKAESKYYLTMLHPLTNPLLGAPSTLVRFTWVAARILERKQVLLLRKVPSPSVHLWCDIAMTAGANFLSINAGAGN